MEYLALGGMLLVGVLVGVFFGIWLGMERMRKAVETGSVGNLRIDRSEPDELPRPHLEIYAGNTVDTISQKKFVLLKVINENYLSSN